MFTPLYDRIVSFVDGTNINIKRVTSYVLGGWIALYLFATILLLAGGDMPQRGIVDNTSILNGWIHGFYIIPEFIAGLVSKSITIHQAGGGIGYDAAYIFGILLMVRTLRVTVKAFRGIVLEDD